MRLSIGIAVIASATLASQAGTVNVGSFSDNSSLVTNYQLLAGTTNTRINHISGITGSSQMNFISTEYVAGTGNATFDVDIAASTGNFYLGAASGLSNAWFSAPRPDGSTETLAFGNNQSATNTNSVTLTFDPNVTAFGFNFDDVEVADLIVTWSDGSSMDQTISQESGFLSFVGAISSITLTQDTSSGDANDGFTFYGFQTIQVVPLPAPVLAGIGMLGALGVARRLRQK